MPSPAICVSAYAPRPGTLRGDAETRRPCIEAESAGSLYQPKMLVFFREKRKAFSSIIPVRTILPHSRHKSIQRGDRHNWPLCQFNTYPEILNAYEVKQSTLK